jgi:hypothetical protein
MINSLGVFKKGIADLRKYVEIGIIEQNKLLASLTEAGELTYLETRFVEFQGKFDEIKTSKRMFDYSTVIISLYGFLERFIENSAKEYLRYLNKTIKDYKNLPQAIQDNHYEVSAILLTNLKIDKYRNLVSKEDIITNLYYCLQNSGSYALNVDAYTHHTANFRQGVINEFFSSLGIKGISSLVKNHPGFKSYILKVKPEIELAYSNIEESVIYQTLDDLAQRRNDISHGVEGIEILSSEILLDYINYLEQYSEAICDVVFETLLPYEVSHCAIVLKKPIAIYKNSIICLNLEEAPITIGDRIISKTVLNNSEIKYSHGKVLKLQINNQDHRQIRPSVGGTNIGIEVDFKVKENQEFFLVHQT